VREMLRPPPATCGCDLAFRNDHASGGQVQDPDERARRFSNSPTGHGPAPIPITPERGYTTASTQAGREAELADLPPGCRRADRHFVTARRCLAKHGVAAVTMQRDAKHSGRFVFPSIPAQAGIQASLILLKKASGLRFHRNEGPVLHQPARDADHEPCHENNETRPCGRRCWSRRVRRVHSVANEPNHEPRNLTEERETQHPCHGPWPVPWSADPSTGYPHEQA